MPVAPPSTRPQSRARRRTAALGAALAVGVGLLAAPGQLAAAAPLRDKPDLMMDEVRWVPREAKTGSTFQIDGMVANVGGRRAPMSVMTAHLSKDRRLSDGDKRVGASQVQAMEPGRLGAVGITVRVPDGFPEGKYHVVVCADVRNEIDEIQEGDNCIGSRSQVTIIRDLEGTLTGTLNLYESGFTEQGNTTETLERFAQVQVVAELGGHSADPRLADKDSTYSWMGEITREVDDELCPYTTVEDEEGQGDFDHSSGSSKLAAGLAEKMSSLGVRFRLDLDFTATTTDCHGESWDMSGKNSDMNLVQLVEVARTKRKVVYTVDSWWQDFGIPSHWDTVEGRLVLKIKK
ncbi:CARDB domain-containing protein [Nocardioides ferulae]|uniref:CARDB domain-containing protein n=1 Tax=Nocardioides ferulae TaxID=2340821 RepID=UPI000EB3C569|nr:CARDB domain-containing protein [Nocardioides ferulae]